MQTNKADVATRVVKCAGDFANICVFVNKTVRDLQLSVKKRINDSFCNKKLDFYQNLRLFCTHIANF